MMSLDNAHERMGRKDGIIMLMKSLVQRAVNLGRKDVSRAIVYVRSCMGRRIVATRWWLSRLEQGGG